VNAQAEQLVAIRRLQEPAQRLGVKAAGHDGQFLHRALQSEDLKQARRTKHGETIERVIPEVFIFSQGMKRLDHSIHHINRVLLQQIAVADDVLLVFGMLAMGRLIKRDTGGLVSVESATRVSRVSEVSVMVRAVRW